MYRFSQLTAVAVAVSMGVCMTGCGRRADMKGPTLALRTPLSGSYSPSDSAGVKIWSFDPLTGELRMTGGVKGVSNPSFLHVSADSSRIYAVGEEAGVASSVNMISFDVGNGVLALELSSPIISEAM